MTGAPIVFVVDNDPAVRRVIKRLLASVGLRAELFGSAEEFRRSERPNTASCLVLDIRLPGISVGSISNVNRQRPTFRFRSSLSARMGTFRWPCGP